MGMLKEAVRTLGSDNKRLSKSNENRKDEINKTNTDVQSMLHTVEETNTTVNSLAGAMEEIRGSLTDIKVEMAKNTAELDARIEVLEKRIFDWPQFLRGLITAKGILLVTIVCATISTIILALVAPEHLPLFFDTMKAAK